MHFPPPAKKDLQLFITARSDIKVIIKNNNTFLGLFSHSCAINSRECVCLHIGAVIALDGCMLCGVERKRDAAAQRRKRTKVGLLDGCGGARRRDMMMKRENE